MSLTAPRRPESGTYTQKPTAAAHPAAPTCGLRPPALHGRHGRRGRFGNVMRFSDRPPGPCGPCNRVVASSQPGEEAEPCSLPSSGSRWRGVVGRCDASHVRPRMSLPTPSTRNRRAWPLPSINKRWSPMAQLWKRESNLLNADLAERSRSPSSGMK